MQLKKVRRSLLTQQRQIDASSCNQIKLFMFSTKGYQIKHPSKLDTEPKYMSLIFDENYL